MHINCHKGATKTTLIYSSIKDYAAPHIGIELDEHVSRSSCLVVIHTCIICIRGTHRRQSASYQWNEWDNIVCIHR